MTTSDSANLDCTIPPWTQESIAERIRAEVGEILGLAAGAIDPDVRFRDYGLDSAKAAVVLTRLTEMLGHPLPATLPWECPTVRRMAGRIASEAAVGFGSRVSVATDSSPPAAADEAIAIGVEVPLRTLFATPRLGELARAVEAAQRQAAPEPALVSQTAFSRILPLRPRGDLPPLFCIYPGGGLAWSYAALVPLIAGEWPVYGIQEPGIGDPTPLPTSVETAVEDCLCELPKIQPTGPYHLLGWSFGGMLGFAMACQLQEQGEEVALLAVIDSYPISNPDGLQEPAAEALAELETLWSHLVSKKTSP